MTREFTGKAQTTGIDLVTEYYLLFSQDLKRVERGYYKDFESGDLKRFQVFNDKGSSPIALKDQKYFSLPAPKAFELGCQTFVTGTQLTVLHQGNREEEETAGQNILSKSFKKIMKRLKKFTNKIKIEKLRDQTYFFLNFTDQMAFSKIQSA